MILSHRHRFIFLKTAKTAGTSVEIALSRFAGLDDVITPISRVDEQLRQECGGHGPRNYRLPLWRLNPGRIARTLLKGRWPGYYNHMPGSEVREYVGAEVWGSYFRFCIERNPFDRVLSLYWWCHRREPRPAISDFLRSPQLDLLTQRGIALYTDSRGGVMVDQVLRYEELEAELETVRQRLGLPEALKLPRAKGGHRPGQQSWREVFNAADRRFIEQRFEREFELFGYGW